VGIKLDEKEHQVKKKKKSEGKSAYRGLGRGGQWKKMTKPAVREQADSRSVRQEKMSWKFSELPNF